MFVLALLAAATLSPGDGKTMAMDDWQSFTVASVGQTVEGPYYLDVNAGDLDGDGLADGAYLKLVCAGGQLRDAAYEIKSRDAASGMATGKRMHKPVTFVKEWGPASPQLMAAKPTYDVKSQTKGRMAAGAEGWTQLSLSSGDKMCAALDEQRAAIIKTKTKSNQSND